LVPFPTRPSRLSASRRYRQQMPSASNTSGLRRGLESLGRLLRSIEIGTIDFQSQPADGDVDCVVRALSRLPGPDFSPAVCSRNSGDMSSRLRLALPSASAQTFRLWPVAALRTTRVDAEQSRVAGPSGNRRAAMPSEDLPGAARGPRSRRGTCVTPAAR